MKTGKIEKRTVMVLLVGLLVAAASWMLFTRPAAEKLDEAATERAAVEQDLLLLAQQRQQLAQGIDPLESWYGIVEYADGLFPTADSVRETKLAAELSTSAASRGIEGTSLDVQEPADGGSEGLQVVPVTVSASGTYENVLGWVDELRDEDGLRSIEGLTLSEGEDGQYQVSFTLKVWFSSTPPLAPSATGGTEAGSAPSDGATPPESATGATNPVDAGSVATPAASTPAPAPSN